MGNTRVICAKNRDGTLTLCVDWRQENSFLKTDSAGGSGDMQHISEHLEEEVLLHSDRSCLEIRIEPDC